MAICNQGLSWQVVITTLEVLLRVKVRWWGHMTQWACNFEQERASTQGTTTIWARLLRHRPLYIDCFLVSLLTSSDIPFCQQTFFLLATKRFVDMPVTLGTVWALYILALVCYLQKRDSESKKDLSAWRYEGHTYAKARSFEFTQISGIFTGSVCSIEA